MSSTSLVSAIATFKKTLTYLFRESIKIHEQTKSSSSDEMRTVGEYCDGSGFMMTSQVGRSIMREAAITKSHSDENLYITGILRNDEIIDTLLIY